MSLLLDTHAFLWYALDDARLGAGARAAIDNERDSVFISPASYWELAIKISYRRYTLRVPFDEFWENAIAEGRLAILPVEIRHASRMIELPLFHRDTFDRMIVAQALSENANLISKDAELDGYGVRRIW